MSKKQSKILIFIVAYHAEKHIQSVFDRISPDLLKDEEVHVLCIDDASTDSSSQAAADWARQNNYNNITILRNPVNQGYGGNQKIGYRYAVDNGFDYVILLHGDGQYAPELLPEFIKLWKETNADVVLGSRMHSVKSARKGGMPVYKILGNKILTNFQNAVTGQNLSEYHTGYRAYSTDYLRSVPFEVNTNDFHFDTEILLQAFHTKAKIAELPIPTHYGDEICRVNGLRYAKDVVVSTLQYKMNKFGMFCSLKYRNIGSNIYENKTDQRYSSHAVALNAVRQAKPGKLLDIGCGPGFVARCCTDMGVRVTGVDLFDPPSDHMMDQFFRVNLETQDLPVDALSFDMVLMMDIIEHLSNPEQFLLKLRNETTADLVGAKAPVLVISTPNIAFASIRAGLLFGRFNYADRGILDITHKRLFTSSSLRQMLTDCGYDIEGWRAVGPPFELVINNKLGTTLSYLCDILARLMPDLFGFQFVATVRPKPGVKQLLSRIEKKLVGRDAFQQKLEADLELVHR
ncbi:MAG: glycosyltransferase [Cyanobacteria bacterium SZAS-4]|nr:glycosyltransferase [Cyanobacteria bacterium SZAS-4]